VKAPDPTKHITQKPGIGVGDGRYYGRREGGVSHQTERQILTHTIIIQSIRLKVREWLYGRRKGEGYNYCVAITIVLR
jgi:hypothetical protein